MQSTDELAPRPNVAASKRLLRINQGSGALVEYFLATDKHEEGDGRA